MLRVRYRLTQKKLGVKAILITKLEVRALKPKIKLFGKSYFFYFEKC
jgi:hypothetical protein